MKSKYTYYSRFISAMPITQTQKNVQIKQNNSFLTLRNLTKQNQWNSLCKYALLIISISHSNFCLDVINTIQKKSVLKFFKGWLENKPA